MPRLLPKNDLRAFCANLFRATRVRRPRLRSITPRVFISRLTGERISISSMTSSLLHQDFKSGAAELTVDIYDMGGPEMRLAFMRRSARLLTNSWRSVPRDIEFREC